jgi:hypothetical protein
MTASHDYLTFYMHISCICTCKLRAPSERMEFKDVHLYDLRNHIKTLYIVVLIRDIYENIKTL